MNNLPATARRPREPRDPAANRFWGVYRLDLRRRLDESGYELQSANTVEAAFVQVIFFKTPADR